MNENEESELKSNKVYRVLSYLFGAGAVLLFLFWLVTVVYKHTSREIQSISVAVLLPPGVTELPVPMFVEHHLGVDWVIAKAAHEWSMVVYYPLGVNVHEWHMQPVDEMGYQALKSEQVAPVVVADRLYTETQTGDSVRAIESFQMMAVVRGTHAIFMGVSQDRIDQMEALIQKRAAVEQGLAEALAVTNQSTTVSTVRKSYIEQLPGGSSQTKRAN